MIVELIKTCFVGPIAYRIFCVILLFLVVIWFYCGIKIVQEEQRLKIFYDGTLANGKTITINEYNRFIIPFEKIYIKNVGTKPLKDVSITIHFSEQLVRYTEMSENTTTQGYWSISKSFLKGYVSLLKFDKEVTLNPEESWNRPYQLVLNMKTPVKSISEISAKLSVYYGLDKPVEVDLILKPSKENK